MKHEHKTASDALICVRLVIYTHGCDSNSIVSWVSFSVHSVSQTPRGTV